MIEKIVLFLDLKVRRSSWSHCLPRKYIETNYKYNKGERPKKLKEKASMAPIASPSIQDGKSELAIQGKHPKTQIEWKNHEKAKSGEKKIEKVERLSEKPKRGKMCGGRERERKRKKREKK